MIKGNRSGPPAFAKVTKDKMLLCSLCGELVKNEMQWNLKHVRSQRHVMELRAMKEEIDNGEVIGNKKEDVKEKEEDRGVVVKEEKERKDKVIKDAIEILDEQFEQSKNDYNLPLNFFDKEEDKDKDKEKALNKDHIKEDNDIIINNKLNQRNDKNKEILKSAQENRTNENNNDNDYVESESIESEVDDMIESAQIVNTIIDKYKHKQQQALSNDNKFLNNKHKREEEPNTKSSPYDNHPTKDDLLSDILKDDW